MPELVKAFARCEKGATALEYGLIAAILSGVIIGASGSIRSALHTLFNTIVANYAAATGT